MLCSFGQPRIKLVWCGHAYHACSATCIDCLICLCFNRSAAHFNISMFGDQTMFDGVWSPNISRLFRATMRQFQSLDILYKCLRAQGLEYLSEFFNVLNVTYNLMGSSTRLVSPSFNLHYMHKSWSYLTTKLWNGLPTRVRECSDLAAFRRVSLSFMARL